MSVFSNKKILLALFAVVILFIVIQACISTNKLPEYHAFLATEEFKGMERSDQIAKCGSCHKEEYDNELNGPHANAYKKLKEHRDFVNGDQYQCAFYTTRVNRDFESCVGCHAPQNLLQTSFYDSLNDMEQVIKRITSMPVPLKREGEVLRMSGIDCMSCHYDGNTIVSLKHQPSPDDSVVSKQTLSVMINNNLNCYPCHMQIVKSFNPAMSIKQTGSVMCVNCHQEYKKEKGKGTHYFYWQHGSEDRKNPIFNKFMDDFHPEVMYDKNGPWGEVTWNNTMIPHGISSGPEIIIECKLFNKDSIVLGEHTIRINNKKLFDEEMYTTMGNNYLFGTLGDTVPLNGKPIGYIFPLKGDDVEYYKISLYHKAQYWFPDTLRVLTAEKIIPYQSKAP